MQRIAQFGRQHSEACGVNQCFQAQCIPNAVSSTALFSPDAEERREARARKAAAATRESTAQRQDREALESQAQAIAEAQADAGAAPDHLWRCTALLLLEHSSLAGARTVCARTFCWCCALPLLVHAPPAGACKARACTWLVMRESPGQEPHICNRDCVSRCLQRSLAMWAGRFGARHRSH